MQKRLDLSAIQLDPNPQLGGNVELAQSESACVDDGDDFYGYDRKSIFVQFFLIIDEIIKLHTWNHLFYFFQYILPILQIISMSFWPYHEGNWDIKSGENGYDIAVFIRGFSSICSLAPPSKALEFNTASFIAISALYSIMIISLIGCFLYYYFSSRSFRPVLPIISFMVQVLIFAFYLPCAAIFSSTFEGLKVRSTLDIFAFVYLLFMYAIATAYVYFSSSMINYLSNPNRSLFACFDGKHAIYSLFIFSFQFILRGLSPYLPFWFTYFIVIIDIILYAFLIYDLFSIPFVHYYINCAVGGMYCMSIISTILIFFKIKPILRLLLPIGAFLIGFVVLTIVFIFIRRHVLIILTAEDLLIETQKEEFLAGIKIQSLVSAYQYLHIGFIYHSMQIYNGSFSFFLAQKVQNVDFWISVTGIMSFFPGERNNFSYCVNCMKLLYPRKFIDKLRILHFSKLEQHRYLTSTSEISRRLMYLNAATNDAITLTKRFWLDVSKSENRLVLGTLNNIAGAIIDAKNQWKNTLNLFPNEYRFALEYSSFLVECAGKFEKGMLWNIKANHLERGIHSGVDDLFRVFVCSKPSVLHDHIVDKYGNLCGEGITGMTTSKQGSTHQDKLEEDVENGMIEKLMSERFLWPTLRNHLSRATSHYRPKYLAFFTTLKIFSFAIILMLLILLNIMFTRVFTFFDYSYAMIEAINNERVGLGNLYGSLLLQWGNITGHGITPETFNLTSSMDIHNNSINPHDFNQSLIQWIDSAQTYYVDLFKLMAQDAIAGESIAKLSDQLTKENVRRKVCIKKSDGSLSLEPFLTNTKAAMVSVLWTTQTMIFSNFSEMAEDPLFCELNFLHQVLPAAFTRCSYNFSTFAKTANEGAQQRIVILISVFLVFAIVIWIPLIIIPQFIVQKEAQRVFGALRSVDKAAAIVASQKLSLVDDSSDQNYVVSQQHMYSYSSIILMLRLLYVFMVLVILACAGVSFNILSDTCNKLEKYVLLDHYGSTRHGQCSEIFALVVYKLVGKEIGMNYINLTALQELFTLSMNELIDNSNMFIHGENNDGMSKYSKEITKLHIDDKCDAQTGESVFYKCMSFQRSISSFVIAAKGLMTDNYNGDGLNTKKFVDFYHISVGEINEMNWDSRNLTDNLIQSTKSFSLSITISLLTIALAVDISAFILDMLFDNKLIRLLKTALLLIRHLPPPSIVESPQLLSILLVQTDDQIRERQSNIYDVIFNCITSPVLLIGEGNIIESVNRSFQTTYGLQEDQIVGHNLNTFISQPLVEEPDMSPEEQGAFHLYEKLSLIMTQEIDEDTFSYVTKCTSNDDENMTVNVTVYSVKNNMDQISGFVIIVEDKSRSIDAEGQLTELRKNVEQLVTQLIPRNFTSVVEDKGTHFSFIIPNSFVVVVHINNIEQVLERSWEDYDKLLIALEFDSHQNSPFIFLKTVYDVICFVGGIFEEKEMKELAVISLDFGKTMMKTLDSKINANIDDTKRFSVGIAAGGPLIGGLVHEKNPFFDVSGELLNEARKIAVLTPNEAILMSAEAKKYFPEDYLINEGPILDGKPTYFHMSLY